MSQKYRQRGYRDDDRDESRQSSSSGSGPLSSRAPRDPSLRPGGRGLGQPTATVFRCAVCGHPQSSEVTLDSTCQKCSGDLHTCTHCVFFDASARNECRKDVREPVASKAKRNSCELFEPKSAREFAKEDSPKSARDAFDALFK